VARRAEKLGIVDLHLGVRDKLPLVEKVLAEKNLDWSSIAYIGDDVNDLEVLRRAGFSACPSDGVDDVKEVVNVVLRNRGGNGAFREFAEMIMKESPSARPTTLP
jgi:3-deoxy-D-manno-octulosonate 8-phosphate phosphatase (KDO 8-P phosphatase)